MITLFVKIFNVQKMWIFDLMVYMSSIFHLASTLYNYDFEYVLRIKHQWSMDDQSETTLFVSVHVGLPLLFVIEHIVC